MNFRVGQKVVCVDDTSSCPGEDNAPGGTVKEGIVYTISNSYESFFYGQMIELVEVHAPGDDDWLAGFKADHFRPAVERKTDISIFRKLLTPSPERVE